MIYHVGTADVDGYNILTADVNAGVQLKVQAGSDDGSGDSRKSFVSVSTEDAHFECDSGSDGFDLRIVGDFELKAFAEAFEFIASVLKSRLKYDHGLIV